MGDHATGGGDAVDETLGALADARRRTIVRYLIESEDGVATRERLVKHLQAKGFEADRDQLLQELHHRHLPKLDDAGLIEHDSRSEKVRYLGDEIAETILDELEQES